MKTGQVILAIICLGIAGNTAAMESPSIQLGEKLFHSSALGTTGKSCESCHRGGKGLAEIDAYDDEQLRVIVNACIRDALGGRLLSPESQELDSLVIYLRSLKVRQPQSKP